MRSHQSPLVLSVYGWSHGKEKAAILQTARRPIIAGTYSTKRNSGKDIVDRGNPIACRSGGYRTPYALPLRKRGEPLKASLCVSNITDILPMITYHRLGLWFIGG